MVRRLVSSEYRSIILETNLLSRKKKFFETILPSIGKCGWETSLKHLARLNLFTWSFGLQVTRVLSADLRQLPATLLARWLGWRTRITGKGWVSSSYTPRNVGGSGTPSSSCGRLLSSLGKATSWTLSRILGGEGWQWLTLQYQVLLLKEKETHNISQTSNISR